MFFFAQLSCLIYSYLFLLGRKKSTQPARKNGFSISSSGPPNTNWSSTSFWIFQSVQPLRNAFGSLGKCGKQLQHKKRRSKETGKREIRERFECGGIHEHQFYAINSISCLWDIPAQIKILSQIAAKFCLSQCNFINLSYATATIVEAKDFVTSQFRYR